MAYPELEVAAAIDVVIAVYNAPADVVRCVQSVLAHTGGDYRLVLIDDASPDSTIATVFAEIAARHLPHVLLLRNEVNLGFTGTANRGMSLSRNDVVLLNSDTVVTAGWLDALRRCAATNPSFGTITPFSNNAEICSFPSFCADNEWRYGADPEGTRAALERAAVPTYPDLPTGVGFCMYVRRTLIDAIGTFDPVFGLGYGEENDFCLRGFAVGYRNVLCDDAFVLHLGARSFAGQKAELGRRNLALLLERHPHYSSMVRDYIAADPLRPIRDAALALDRALQRHQPGLLHVIHGHAGGTEHHARALMRSLRGRYRHYLLKAVGEHWLLEEQLDDGSARTFEFRHDLAEAWASLLRSLCGTFAIDVVHLHNVSGSHEGLLSGLEDFPLPYGYTVHDSYLACPTITLLASDGMYCGGETDPARCRDCLADHAIFEGVDIAVWRRRHARLLERAAFVIAPSRSAAQQLARYFVMPTVDHIPHGPTGEEDSGIRHTAPAARTAVLLPRDDVPTIAVAGAIGPDKGARRLERLVALARRRGDRVRFVLIGYMDREHGPWQSEDALFTIHGRYRNRDLADLFEHYRVQLVMFPSAGPETFSFTLSESWACGRPVLVPPIGALGERVRDHGGGWVWTDAEWRSETLMLDAALAVLAPAARGDRERMAAEAARIRQTTLEEMAARTAAVYERTLSSVSAAAVLPQLDRARVRDALGYRLWYPPIASTITEVTARPADLAAAPTPALRRWLGRARRSRFWRVLRTVTPLPVRTALRTRLWR